MIHLIVQQDLEHSLLEIVQPRVASYFTYSPAIFGIFADQIRGKMSLQERTSSSMTGLRKLRTIDIWSMKSTDQHCPWITHNFGREEM